MRNSGKARSDLRIVVQYVHADIGSPWHLVAYGSGRAFQPRHFRSVDELLKVICLAVPEFEPKHLLIKNELNQSYIAWSADVVLDDAQLATLGLKTDTGPKT